MFSGRQSAGRKLAQKLKGLDTKNAIVIALPRGGVPVGYEIANFLRVPFTVLIVRKLGAPNHKEFGIGAIAEGGAELLDLKSIEELKISEGEIKCIINDEKKELERRVKKYRNGNSLPDLKNKIVILVDDGLATGITAKAAIESIKKFHPRKLIFALPVCAADSIEGIKDMVDYLICLLCPPNFQSVGQGYRDFHQVGDQEVTSLLQKAEKNYQLAI